MLLAVNAKLRRVVNLRNPASVTLLYTYIYIYILGILVVRIVNDSIKIIVVFAAVYLKHSDME